MGDPRDAAVGALFGLAVDLTKRAGNYKLDTASRGLQ